MNWYILIPVVVGIICLIFGYLIGKLKPEEDNSGYLEIISKLESDIDDCRAK